MQPERNKPLSEQQIRYLVVGGVVACLYVLVYGGFTGLGILMAFGVGFVAISLSYKWFETRFQQWRARRRHEWHDV